MLRHLLVSNAIQPQSQYRGRLTDFLHTLDQTWRVQTRQAGLIEWIGVEKAHAQLPRQGWKLHVSVSAARAHEIIAVAEELVSLGVSFKLPSTEDAIVRINGGDAGETQIGKVMTAYFAAEEQIAHSVERLCRLPLARTGPKVAGEYEVGNAGLFLRYGVLSTREARPNARGAYVQDVCLDDGSVALDERGSIPRHWPKPPIPARPSEVPDFTETEIDGVKYVPILRLQKTARGGVYMGVRLPDAASVVIKTARRGVAGDLEGFDGTAKLANEYACMEALWRRGVCARPCGFANGEIAVLVSDDLGGESYARLAPALQRAMLPKVRALVEALHAAGFVHRDLKAENLVRADDGEIYLTDFELSSAIGDTRLAGGGTWGHIPPEAVNAASPATDIYAFGALAAGIVLGCSPTALPRESGRYVGLLRRTGETEMSKLVARATLASPRHRTLPSCAELTAALHASASPRHCSQLSSAQRRWALRAAFEAAAHSREFKVNVSRGNVAWRNAHYASDFLCHGLNLGAAGIILGLSVVSGATGQARAFERDIEEGLNWLKGEELHGSPGLFVGEAGVALALALGAARLSRPDLAEQALVRLRRAVATCVEHELFFGAAGVLEAGILMDAVLQDGRAIEISSSLAGKLVRCAEDRDGLLCWPFVERFEGRHDPLNGVAHGAAGIAVALSNWSKVSDDRSFRDLAQATMRSLYANARSADGRFLRRAGADISAADGEWCHGVAGYLWALIRCDMADDPAFDWAATRVLQAPVIGNATYCHGLAGRLELACMLTTVDRWRDQARSLSHHIAQTLRQISQRRNGRIVWASEDPRIVTPDLWVGTLGPACALSLYATARTHPILATDALRLAAGI